MTQYPPIQIVDDNDQPIGEASLEEIHEKNLIHRIVFIGVFDEAGRFLLQRRSKKVLTYPDTWDVSAAGHVDAGETYEEAAVRELEEEIGLSGFELDEVSRFYKEFRIDNITLRRFNRAYKVIVSDGTNLKPNEEEVSDLKWMSINEIRQELKDKPQEFANGVSDFLDHFGDENNEH